MRLIEVPSHSPVKEYSHSTETIPDEVKTHSDIEAELAKTPRHFKAKPSIISQGSSFNDSLSNSNIASFFESLSYTPPLPLLTLPSLPHKMLFSACSRFLLFTYPCYIRVYNIITNSQEVLFTNLDHSCISMSMNSLYIATGAGNKVFIWNLATGQKESELVGHFSTVTSVEFSNDGKYIISASEDNSLRIWKLEDMKMTGVLRGHHDKVICLAVSYDSSLIASGSINGTVIIWSIHKKSQVIKIEAHENGVTSVAFPTSGRYCLSGGMDLSMKIWSIERQELEDEFLEFTDWPREIRISSDDGFCVVLCEDMTVTVVNLMTRTMTYRLEACGKICTMMVSEFDASLACGRDIGEQAEIVIYG
jgi:WD40 repeat protein